MPHMVPVAEYFNEETGLLISPSAGECSECDSHTTHFNMLVGGEELVCVECAPVESGFYARLSAPGFLDCTEWMGPYTSRQAAINAVCEEHGVNEDGEDLNYEEE